MDKILTQRFKSSIIRISTITYSSADITSVRDLVVCTLRLKLRSNKRQKIKRVRFNVNRLMNPNISKLYSSKLDEKFNNLYINCDTTNIYTQFGQIIINTASEVIGKYRSK